MRASRRASAAISSPSWPPSSRPCRAGRCPWLSATAKPKPYTCRRKARVSSPRRSPASGCRSAKGIGHRVGREPRMRDPAPDGACRRGQRLRRARWCRGRGCRRVGAGAQRSRTWPAPSQGSVLDDSTEPLPGPPGAPDTGMSTGAAAAGDGVRLQRSRPQARGVHIRATAAGAGRLQPCDTAGRPGVASTPVPRARRLRRRASRSTSQSTREDER